MSDGREATAAKVTRLSLMKRHVGVMIPTTWRGNARMRIALDLPYPLTESSAVVIALGFRPQTSASSPEGLCQ
jgi:hypothetical protein